MVRPKRKALFPEMWSCGYDIPEDIGVLKSMAVSADGDFVSAFKSPKRDESKEKVHYWAQLQINISEFGFVDYQNIYNAYDKPQYVSRYEYLKFADLSKLAIGEQKRVVFCARISEVEEKKYKDSRDGTNKKFGKVMFQQNTDLTQVTMWNDAWEENKQFMQKGNIIIAVAMTKFSEYDGKNVLQINKGAFVVSV